MLGALLNGKSDLSVRNGILLYKLLIRPMTMFALLGGPLPSRMSGGYRCCNQSVFALPLVPPGT
jgi:hypothetical protein